MATATLNKNVDFAVGTAGNDATKWKIFDHESAGNELWAANLSNNPAALTANQFYRVRSGQIVVTQATGSGGATEEFAKRELKGALGPTVWLQLFDRHNSADRSLTGRVAIQLADWTIA